MYLSKARKDTNSRTLSSARLINRINITIIIVVVVVVSSGEKHPQQYCAL